MFYGAHTFAPSSSVLRNLKHKTLISKRYNSNWLINLQLLQKQFQKASDPFVRFISAYPPSVAVYSDGQVKTFKDLCRKDIIYFDATGGILKPSESNRKYQIYTLLVRNPFDGGPNLPIASYISTMHDSSSIKRFLELFLNDSVRICNNKKKPLVMMIDGSKAMWNAVLGAMCSESRLEYYIRWYRIVSGKAKPGDFQRLLVRNCLSHVMKSAKIFVCEHFK